MVDQRNYLEEARTALADPGAPAAQRLRLAATLFRHAYIYQGAGWPPSLRLRADELLRRLMGHGQMFRHLSELDEQTATGLCDDLAQLLNELTTGA